MRTPEEWTIKAARERVGMTRPQLAERLTALLGRQYSRHAVGRIERGERDVSIAELRALCDVLDTTPAFVVYGRGPISPRDTIAARPNWHQGGRVIPMDAGVVSTTGDCRLSA